MASLTFIGDELSAAGFRLAGVQTLTPGKPETADVFGRAREDCELLIITAEYAREIPGGVLKQAMRSGSPLVLIVPDVRGQVQPPDLVNEVERTLGIES